MGAAAVSGAVTSSDHVYMHAYLHVPTCNIAACESTARFGVHAWYSMMVMHMTAAAVTVVTAYMSPIKTLGCMNHSHREMLTTMPTCSWTLLQ